jgi:hypothetical protein
MVRYGTSAVDKRAFTKNLSETGICLKTNAVVRPGTTLQLEIQSEEIKFSMWGQVIWAKKVPPQLAHVLDCGMGIRFIDPDSGWIDFARTWRPARR